MIESEIEIKDKSNPKLDLKIEPFRKHVRKTKAHKHNSYFEIIYLSQGTGTHTIDSLVHKIETPTIFTVRKEQVHHWNILSEPEGFVIIIKNNYIQNCIDKQIKQLIYKLSRYNIISYNTDNTSSLFQLLHSESLSNSPYQSTIIEGLLKALLGRLLNSSSKDITTEQHKNKRFHLFIDALNSEELKMNKVGYFADKLNITVANLNQLCKIEVGKSATQLIAESIINEAKRQLLYTDNNLNEICFDLGFNDDSNFIKFFKRNTLSTPNQYRKLNR